MADSSTNTTVATASSTNPVATTDTTKNTQTAADATSATTDSNTITDPNPDLKPGEAFAISGDIQKTIDTIKKDGKYKSAASDNSSYQTPGLGDFYLGAVDDKYMQMLDNMLKGNNVQADGGVGENAAFYTETPPITDLGEINGQYFLKAAPASDDGSGWVNGCTLRLDISSLSSGKDDTAVKKLNSTLSDGKLNSADHIMFSLYGMDCPQPNRWANESCVPSQFITRKVASAAEFTKDPMFVYDPDVSDNDEQRTFVQIGGKWYQMDVQSEAGGCVTFRWLVAPHTGDSAAAKTAADKIAEYTKRAGDIYIQVDSSDAKSGDSLGDVSRDSDAVSMLKNWAGVKTSGAANGYCLLKEDVYGHKCGTAYIKTDDKWVNLAKAMLCEDVPGMRVNNSFTGDDTKYYPQNYDQGQLTFADAYFKVNQKLDNRADIQSKIFGKNKEELRKWTVAIGDVTLLIPPTSISIISEVEEERIPLLRASGSMPKAGKRNTRTIAMEIFFYGKNGINGYEYNPSETDANAAKYSMNGLRSLIAEFKFTPFLPIENDYINKTAGIQAVVFNSLAIDNVKGTPRLMKATLTMMEFDYSAYIPEVSCQAAEADYDGNWFATAFNWDVMRYYYQRCIQAGDRMHNVGYDVTSKEYLCESLKNRTALQPMDFNTSTMKFFIADMNYLEKMLDARLQREKEKALSIEYTPEETQAFNDIADSSKTIDSALNSDEFKKALEDLNSQGKIQVKGTHYHNGVPNYATTLYDSGIEAVDSDGNAHDLTPKLNSTLGILKDKISEDPNVDSVRLVTMRSANSTDPESTGAYTYTIGVAVQFKGKASHDSDVLNNIHRNVSNFIDCQEGDFFQSGQLIVPLSISAHQPGVLKPSVDDGNGFQVNSSHPDSKFMNYCKNYADERGTNEGKETNKDGWKQAPNIAQLNDMAFVPFDCGSYVVTSFSAQLTNRTSRLNVEDISGASPQYLGGEDVIFEVNIQTSDDACASAFENIPGLTAMIMRRYRMVIPCCPFKVDSEFTRFLGVNEVSVTNTRVNTVPGMPGVYDITISMRSTDRTLRNREALQMIEANNAGDAYNGDQAEKTAKSYFDIEKTLAKAELYPDLELPTIDEVSKAGWEFMRYKFQDERVYVDPDFYFVYRTQLTSQYLREAIMRSVEAGADGSSKYTDSNGASLSLSPKKYVGVEASGMNALAKSQMKQISAAQNARYALDAKQTQENLRDAGKSNMNVEDYEGWDICNDIKAMFMEKRYKKEYDSYVAREKAASVGSNTSDTAASTVVKDTTSVASAAQTGTTTPTASNAAASTSSDSSTTSDAEKEKQNAAEMAAAPDSATDKNKRTEGKWVMEQLEDSRRASKKIKEYLYQKHIELDIPGSSAIRDQYLKDRESGSDTQKDYDALKQDILNGVAEFFNQQDVMQIMELLNVDVSSKFIEVTKDIVFSAACAATGEKEYTNKKKSTNWMPAPDFIGVSSGGGIQDSTKATTLKNVSAACMTATEFGCFKIKQYSRSEFLKVTSEDPDNGQEDDGTINTNHYLIDPYYRGQDADHIIAYKMGCINSPKFCTYAFMRLMLYWLKKLIDSQAFPSINGDILRKATKTELDIQKTQKDKGVANTEQPEEKLQANVKFFSRNTYMIDAGKMWTCATLANSDGSSIVRSRIDNRDYRALNEYTHGCSVPKTMVDPNDKVSNSMRKMNLALIGTGRIGDSDATGVPQDMPAVPHSEDLSDKKYIDAAEDPKQYNVDACHDMIVSDCRGRMLRAFPTYYMLFIDEGRNVGTYHLHDNFYNNMSIMEFTVVKDRKNPADTATIKISNAYQSFTTESEDRLKYAENEGYVDAFRSIFFPVLFGYAQKQEEKRKAQGVQDKNRITPGTRIHLRAGYGSNAAMLQTIFNGVIAEATAQDTLDITAQGDGLELMNPIMEQKEAHNVSNTSGWLCNGETPKEIMTDILTTDGSVFKSLLKMVGRADLLGDNPYGIYHFGDKHFTDIEKSGEVVQNIFEAWSKPAWGDSGDATNMFGVDNAPSITFDVFGKTVWDIANICKSVMPDFICGVAPFDMRSTLFIGAPRYYYAYSYMQNGDSIKEKREPYQQYHIYTSYSDIIANGIAASSQKMKTTATGLYQVAASFNTKEQHKVGPLYVDFDIYPEEQKSMIVDTQLFAKGAPFIGAAGLNALTSFETVDDIVGNDDAGFFTGGHNMRSKAIAWRMTASALKDSVKEMYCGDMVVIGDGSVKPHDRVFISDNYEGITGQATVKEVVHHMSVEQGFITTISPDCINIVDDKFEYTTHKWFDGVAVLGSSALATAGIMAAAYKYGTSATVGKVMDFLKPKATIEFLNKHAEGAMNIARDAVGAAKAAGKSWIKDGIAGLAEKEVVKKAAGSAAGGVMERAVAGATVGAMAGPQGAVAGFLFTLAATAAIDFVSSTVLLGVSDFKKNLQVLTIFPLKRYGLVWTAGVAGSKGLVYGSPTFGEQGAVTNLMNLITSPIDTIGNMISGVASTPQAQTGYSKALRDNGILDSDGKPTGQPEHFNNMLKGAGAAPENEGVKQDYRRMQVVPRADYSKGDDVLLSYNRFAMTDPKNFQSDPKLQYNNMISDDRRLTPYVQEGFFKIIHETPALNTGKFVDTKIIQINGESKYVKTMEYPLDDGSLVYDLPMLNKDAIDILYEIVRRAKNNMPAANSSDPYESYDETKTSFIALESALRVGDTQSQAAAGFTFILQPVDNAVNATAAAIEELNKEIAEDAKSNSLNEPSLFDSKDIGDNKIAVTVRMPRVSGANAGVEEVKSST